MCPYCRAGSSAWPSNMAALQTYIVARFIDLPPVAEARPGAGETTMSCAAEHQVGAIRGGLDAQGVDLVGAVRAVVGLGVGAPVAAVALDQAGEADGLIGGKKPDLVEEGAKGAPRVVGEHQVGAIRGGLDAQG